MRMRGRSVGAELEDMLKRCREGNGGMLSDAVVLSLLSSFFPNIPELVRVHAHDSGVPMCCQPPDSLSISREIEVAVSFLDSGGLVWPRPRIVLLLL